MPLSAPVLRWLFTAQGQPRGAFLVRQLSSCASPISTGGVMYFLLSSNIKTRTPISNPPNQSFSRSDGSIVPTSLTY